MNQKLITKMFFFAAIIFHGCLNGYGQKVIIGGVCKNVERALSNIIKNFEKLGSLFKDYAVVIYENNSTDNTASRLKKWAKSNKSVVIISENLSPDKISPIRTVKIANARNRVLEEIKHLKYKDYEFFIMADLNFNMLPN